MGAAHTARCDRIDARMARASQLVEMWRNGNRAYVLREMSFDNGRATGKAAARMVAAVGLLCRTAIDHRMAEAAENILEVIAREGDRP